MNSGFSYNHLFDYAAYSDVGSMSVLCRHCSALKWHDEPPGICCSNGKIKLKPLLPPPEPLKSLLSGNHPDSAHFLNSVRVYNCAFQMISFGVNVISEGNFTPTFKVMGQVYHLIGSLLPLRNEEHRFLQIYFLSDYMQQTNSRMTHIPHLKHALVHDLQDMLHNNNSYVQSFKTSLQCLSEDNINDYKLVIHADRKPINEHRGRHNAPTTDEVAVLLVNQDCGRRDIILRTQDDRLNRVNETLRSYDALQYPLMFPYGEDGYNFSVCQFNPNTGIENPQKKTSALQFYSYRLMVRHEGSNHLLYFRQLFSQFIVDMYAKIETERLLFIRQNQTKLRVENYIHLKDALRQDGEKTDFGRLMILPPSFTGSSRYMHERTQDAFCYVRKYSRPDLFVTITTNPKWREIVTELLPGQSARDRHDIVSRVFHLNLKKLMNMITKCKIFGPVLCFMYSVEWQKRGLPHAHLLLWFEEKIRPIQIDSVICAEISDPSTDPELYNIVKTHMIHGPCGVINPQSPCMCENHCTKRYSRLFASETVTGEDGYPSYKRTKPSKGGFTATIRSNGRDIVVDNRWVVPFSPVLSRTFQAHVNVEYCNSVKSIKYICKYVNKGSDQACFSVHNEVDEVMVISPADI